MRTASRDLNAHSDYSKSIKYWELSDLSDRTLTLQIYNKSALAKIALILLHSCALGARFCLREANSEVSDHFSFAFSGRWAAVISLKYSLTCYR